MLAVFWKGHAARSLRGMRLFSWLLLLGIAVGLTGCGGCSSKTPSSSSGGSKKKVATTGRDSLDPAIAMMRPDRLGIHTNADHAAGLLNQWRAVQVEIGTPGIREPLSGETRKLLERDLSPDALKHAEREEFSPSDANYIRTCMLMKAIVDHVAKGVDGELNRAQVVFDYVTRNIELVAEENALPLTPYEMLAFGEGTPADRAWIFAELLRQLNQDAVIVKSASEESAWFVGAIVQGEFRLFDPLRSTPVPTALHANRDDILPATLADLSKSSVLALLTGGDEKKLTPDMFKKVRIELIGTADLWSRRMASLQNELAGDAAVVISQKLTAEPGDSASIINRLASVENPQWSLDEVHIWKHPQVRFEGFEALESLSERWKPFQAPQRITVDRETGQATLGTFSQLQMRTRSEQLMGQLKEAIQGYLRVQLAYRNLAANLPGDVRTLHADADEDAAFWSGVCQMEQEAYGEAANVFGSYVKQAEQFASSRHGDQARILLARCLIHLGKLPDAMAALKPLKADSPEHPTAMFLRNALGNDEEPALPADNRQSHQPAVAEKPVR